MSDNIFMESNYRKIFQRVDMSYASVLVVDDVVPNLDVVKGMLKPYRLNVDCVTSAAEAIANIREEKIHYDAVFMDHLMPRMNGIEAVNIIREQIGTEYAKNIPIIALTASTSVDSDTLFSENGFQAFLSKPIDIEKLDIVLNQWVKNTQKEHLPSAAEKTGRTELFTGVRITGLKIAEGIIRFGNDQKSYLQVLQSYIAHTPYFISIIKTFSDESSPGDIDNYLIAAHSLKGSARGIGAEKIGVMAGDLESAAKQMDINFIRENNGRFIAAIEQLIANIGDFLKTVPTNELFDEPYC